MLIAQISDTHICAAGKKAYSVAHTDALLLRCIEHIKQLNPPPDLVLVSGDISYSDQPEEYRRAARLLDRLNMPYYVIPGNHDSRENLLAGFKHNHCPLTDEDRKTGFINYTIDDYPLRLIALDSTRPGHPGGEFCPARADWLEHQLSLATGQPTIIFTHHPPLKLGVLETDRDGFSGADRLGAIVARFPNIKRLFCGHTHLPTFSEWNGAIVSTCPSTGLQLLLDLTQQQPSQFYLDDPAYQLHHCTPEGNCVSHTVSVKPQDGPYSFEMPALQ